MEKTAKFILTIMIWVLCAGISLAALLSNNGFISGDIVALISLPLLAAILGTAVLWVGEEFVARRLESSATHGESSEKSKRDAVHSPSKLELLMEMMDEDERQAFKEALKQRILADASVGDDGEWSDSAMSLESLLDDAESSQRLRR